MAQIERTRKQADQRLTEQEELDEIRFAAFGVNIAVQYQTMPEKVNFKKSLLSEIPGAEKIDGSEREERAERAEAVFHLFRISLRDGEYLLSKDDREVYQGAELADVIGVLKNRIRSTIAEFAVGKVFVHAGVVAWKGKAIVCPAQTFHGKTTLIKTLVDHGAIYYSDDCAVLDEEGMVHPFAKTLSLRGIAGRLSQVECQVEQLGGVRGHKPLPVGMILLTEFTVGAVWEPSRLTAGQGVFEMLSHTIPIRYNPKFSLKVLNNAANRAIIVKMKRGDANLFAVNLIKYFEEKAIYG